MYDAYQSVVFLENADSVAKFDTRLGQLALNLAVATTLGGSTGSIDKPKAPQKFDVVCPLVGMNVEVVFTPSSTSVRSTVSVTALLPAWACMPHTSDVVP